MTLYLSLVPDIRELNQGFIAPNPVVKGCPDGDRNLNIKVYISAFLSSPPHRLKFEELGCFLDFSDRISSGEDKYIQKMTEKLSSTARICLNPTFVVAKASFALKANKKFNKKKLVKEFRYFFLVEIRVYDLW
ncbi:10396_t:CDS:1 [Ambispora gerdemannii]|uniref:10396_t:CDS:1 n=1 Tax=Ambispora gerdemannii TaxID=144530 RepID=A0A9N8VFK7_9GLOM|nr:10396_t:CDS:1 [Ambispora gerdemannii]